MKDATYQISSHAEADLDNIYTYSLLTHGSRQADKYLASVYSCFETLAAHPYMGTSISYIMVGALRHTHEEHVIYYEPSKPLLILRVLGGAQDPLKQFTKD